MLESTAANLEEWYFTVHTLRKKIFLPSRPNCYADMQTVHPSE